MFNKLLFNNQLLANKKIVQKAKIVAINKLVQKIRKLKSLAEKNPENTKVKEKILKTTDVLSCVKKLKNIEILKNALINETNPVVIITNGRSLPEEIASAILFATKQITDTVQKIKELLSLNDEVNPGWQDKILELSKKKQKQLRTEQKKEIRQQRKARHELTLKRTEWLEENLPENLLKNDSTTDTKESEIVPTESDAVKKPEKKRKLSKKVEKDTKELEVVTTESEIVEKPEKKIKLTKKFKEKPKKNLFKSEKIFNEKDKNNSEHELEVLKSVDPFFVTENGDNYLSTVVIDRVQPGGPNDGMIRKERRAYQNCGNRYPKIRKNNFKNSTDFGNSKLKILETNNNWQNKHITQNKSNNLKEIKTEEKLHPSWACKQKEKGIKEFSGKKIVFDESEEGMLMEKIVHKPKDDTGKKLHPSWEAKQKEKGIKIFSGMKTRFESKENNTSKRDDLGSVIKSEEKLHPSWEAKQKLKPIISEFKGKKIKFDD